MVLRGPLGIGPVVGAGIGPGGLGRGIGLNLVGTGVVGRVVRVVGLL